ncbi:MAG TPA: 1,6-anhydro-N-acetylmuramyl-L-alanine amidase AmpD, partial [Methylococcaceae bacterium]|nr:1,6-anhydro-N-acetylmuramyl-L-alanine amidase AmpD [Methylococcaceae bacterium]
FSIGIELEGTETQNYTPAQYACLNRVIDALLNAYPRLSRQRMTGHSDIAPRRKTDPGETFDWTQIIP